MKTRPKTDGELLMTTGILDSCYVSFGEADERMHAQVQREIFSPVGMGLGILSDEARDSLENHLTVKAQLGEVRQRILMTHSRSKKSVRGLIDDTLKDPANEALFNESGMVEVVEGIRIARSVNEHSFRHIKTSHENEQIRHSEWLDPVASGIVLNDNQELATQLFPSGNFLFHATKFERAESIIKAGKILPAQSIIRNIPNPFEAPKTNGGWLGVSCNFNQVSALPSSPYHISGFMFAPEDVLAEGGQLYIPVDASDHELQFYNGPVNIQEYKVEHGQQIIWDKVMKEYGKFMMQYHVAYQQGGDLTTALTNSNLVNTIKRMEKNPELKEKLHSGQLYHFDTDDNMIRFSEELLDSQFSPLAVLTQAMIDGGDAEAYVGQDITAVEQCSLDQLTRLVSGGLKNCFMDEHMAAIMRIRDKVNGHSSTSLSVSDSVFVCSRQDLQTWQVLFATAIEAPRGVVVFDGKDIRVPNFTFEKGLGDHQKLDKVIHTVVPSSDATIEWADLLNQEASQIKKKDAESHFVAAAKTMRARSLTLDDF